MNLLYYLPLFIIGLYATGIELIKKKSQFALFALLFILFSLTICSRIGHDKDYNDLNSYIRNFETDFDSYWEPGFVFFVDIVKLIYGNNSNGFLFSVGLFEVLFILLSFYILTTGDKQYGLSHNERYKNTEILLANNGLIPHNRFVPYGYISLFYFFILYWGCSFGCEVIRLGMAICVLFCSTAACIIDKKFLPFVFLPIAFFLQYSSIFFIVGIIVLLFIKTIRKEILWIIFFLSVFIDFLFAIGILTSSIGESFLGRILSFSDIFSHFDAYTGEEGDATKHFFSLQYWAYHIFGAIMLFGDFSDRHYNRAVCLYYVGLMTGTVFCGTLFVMRLQWSFFPCMIFVLYYYAKNPHYSISSKMFLICGYSVIEAIMALRYLGYYI